MTILNLTTEIYEPTVHAVRLTLRSKFGPRASVKIILPIPKTSFGFKICKS